MSRAPRGDHGLTLIEVVIAMLILSVAVITLVGGLATMVELSKEHRGHAAAETAARSFGQAVQAVAQTSTPLTATISAGATSITVADATTLPAAGSNSYLLVEREVMRVTGINRASGVVTVVRGEGRSTATGHSSGTDVVPLLHCPEASTLTPDPSLYPTATGVSASITRVEYWRPATTSFSTSRNDCLADWAIYCDQAVAATEVDELLAECNPGLFRVTVAVTSGGDSRLRGVGATTAVLVRTGSA